MKTNYTFLGLFVGSILGFLLAAFGIDLIIQTVQTQLTTVFVVGLIALALLSLVYLTIDTLIAHLFRLNANRQDEDFATLEKALERTLPGLPSDGREKISEIARIIGARVTAWRLRAMIISGILGLAVVFGGLVATFVLVRQNELFETQNTFLNQQIVLQEAARFSAYSPLVTDVLADIAREGFEQQQRRLELLDVLQNEFADRTDDNSQTEFESRYYNLSEQTPELSLELTARIIALLAQLEPYPYLATSRENVVSGDIAQSEVLYLSPERGNILETLIRFEFSLSPFQDADFTYADMRGKNLQTEEFDNYIMHVYKGCGHEPRYSFEGLNLAFADFRGAQLGLFYFSVQKGMQLAGATFEASALDLPDADDYGLQDVTLVDTVVVNSSGSSAPSKSASAIDLAGVKISAGFFEYSTPCVRHFVNTSIMELEEIAPSAVDGLTLEFQLVGDEAQLTDGVIGAMITHAQNLPDKPLPQDLLLALFAREDISQAAELEATQGPVEIFRRPLTDVRAFASFTQDERLGPILTIRFR